MTTPVDEKSRPIYPTQDQTTVNRHSSDDDGTIVNDPTSARTPFPPIETDRKPSHLTVDTEDDDDEPRRSMASPSATREQSKRLEDDLTMLEIERQVSQKAHEEEQEDGAGTSMHRSRSRRPDVIDEFETATNPLHEKTALYRPPENPTTSLSKLAKKIHGSNVLIRYFCYITPLALIILCPILLGFYRFRDAHVGGVEMRWFCIWLMIVWLSLWAGRLIASFLPWPMALISSLFTNNSKKWRDMFKQLEVPCTIFFWMLAIEISFLPTMRSHARSGADLSWTKTMNKILIVLLVGATLGFISKILIQLIAISFHLRTYDDRIQVNKFQINSLAKLYKFSKEKIAMEDSDFEEESGTKSGARTPGQILEKAHKGTKEAMKKVGDVAGKVAEDFTGKKVNDSSHPNQVVLQLLSTTGGSQILARRLYRTFNRPETETVHSEDLKNAFDNDEEADAAFQMFDKDLNGDISMEELEAVCVEIGRERKAITASLKDLDSVISKLDDVFIFIVCVVAVLVFISLISTSAAGVLTSAGSAVLALSWLFSATAQEFLQSIIFVFVKHPFDVGDRVGIYGNTGALGLGDDYFVKEIALLYTEFKKMEGHIVQAPNSYLNTLFILNQRRSGGLAEAVPIIIKFGTTLEQIEQLRNRLLDFVTAEKREFQTNILTELRAVTEAHSLTLNVVFFYKSNWQNELLRLQRRNKFICALMVTMQDLGIEGPRMRYPGQKESFPMYLQSVPHIATPHMGHGGNPDHPEGIRSDPNLADRQDPPFVPPADGVNRNPSILKPSSYATRPRGESLAAMGRRVDFSLGMKDVSSSDLMGDIYEDRVRTKLPSMSPSGRGSYERGSSDGKGSGDFARSSGVALKRTPTDASVSTKTSHRNRFFGRKRGGDEEMADIPETLTPEARLDPRSGVVSPTAIRESLDRAR